MPNPATAPRPRNPVPPNPGNPETEMIEIVIAAATETGIAGATGIEGAIASGFSRSSR